MRVCLLSDYAGMRDEGVRNVAFYLGRELSRKHQVLALCLKPSTNLLQPWFWSRLRAFRPQVVHFIAGPTWKCFALMRLVKAWTPGARTIISAVHPALSPLGHWTIRWLRPDLVLTQSSATARLLSRLGCVVRFLSNGVDTETFSPRSTQERAALREKYRLDGIKAVALHIGPLKRGRNVLMLRGLQRAANTQVLVVGNLSVPRHRGVHEALVRSGCLVWRRYFENITEIFALADGYVFPPWGPQEAAETPLSVLEAMACNLPVLSTRFGALPELFPPGDGLYYFDTEAQLLQLWQEVREGGVTIRTREKVLPFSWPTIALKAESLYEELLSTSLH